MKKKSLITITSFLLLFGLVACNNTPSQPAGNKDSDSATVSSEEPGQQSNSGSSDQQGGDSSSQQGGDSSGQQGGDQDQHHFATAWSYDKANHWHVCNDPGCDELGSFGLHNFVKDEQASIAATCTAKGKLVEKCSVCNYVKETITPMTEHDFQKDTEESVDPTCTTAGKLVEKCKDCPETRTTNLDALGHKWEADATDPRNAAATHNTPGISVDKCARCGETRTTESAKIPHEWEYVEGGDITTEGGKTIKVYECDCGYKSYVMDVYDFTYLANGSNATGVDGYSAGTDQGSNGGIRIKGNGSMYWMFKLPAAGRYAVSVGANPAPSSITGTNIAQKNAIKINNAATKLLVNGSYTAVGLVTGEFREVTLTEFDADAEMIASEIKVELTQQNSQRLYFGGVVRLTQVPAHTEHTLTKTTTAGVAPVAEVPAQGTEGEEGYVPGTPAVPGKVATTRGVCSKCTYNEFTFSPLDQYAELEGSNKDGTPAGYLKLNGNNEKVTMRFNLPRNQGVSGKLYIRGIMDSYPGNASKTMYSGKNAETANGNFKITIDGETDVDFSAQKDVTFGSVLGTQQDPNRPGYSKEGMMYLADVTLAANADHTFVFERLDSYNLLVKEFVIVY